MKLNIWFIIKSIKVYFYLLNNKIFFQRELCIKVIYWSSTDRAVDSLPGLSKFLPLIFSLITTPSPLL